MIITIRSSKRLGISFTGIYPSSFINVRFWTKIEFSNNLFQDKRSRNYYKIKLGIWRCSKLRSQFMAEPWCGFRGEKALKNLGLFTSGGKLIYFWMQIWHQSVFICLKIKLYKDVMKLYNEYPIRRLSFLCRLRDIKIPWINPCFNMVDIR